MADKPHVDAVTGIETTGHEWDGIRELNNPMPKWWLYVFYVCIAWAFAYWIFYPAWPLGTDYTKGMLDYNSRAVWEQQISEGRQAQAVWFDRIAAKSLEEIRTDPELLTFAMASGQSVFAQNCAPCHGASGQGAKGFPNLVDDDWLWGGTLDDIYTTVSHGIRANDDETRYSMMPRFGADGLLDKKQINDVVQYILSFTARANDPDAVARGAVLFDENCVACHGEGGSGGREMGAPRLSDDIWLYGGDRATLLETVTYARYGVMPTWAKRLDDPTIKTLAVYVHELGGGE